MQPFLIATAFALVVTGSSAAQQPGATVSDERWHPWFGCWQLLGETVTGDAALSAGSGVINPPAREWSRAGGTRVCVTPADGGGVTIATLVASQRALEETIVADGSRQPMQDAECRGTRKSEWSNYAPRLYSSAEISCRDQAPRKISSLSMMTPGPTWVDIQVIDISGRKNIRVRRYARPDAEQPKRALAAVTGESAWSVDDVKEASAKLAAETIQAALVELRHGFNLKGKQLLELERAGVADSVIDLMVALSYPKHFQVERAVSSAPGPIGSGFGAPYGSGLYDEYDPLWPFYLDSMFWPSYYSPFAYRYWGLHDPSYFRNSGYVVIGQPVGGGKGGDGGAPVASGEGRVVDGRGYTRVRTRQPDPVNVSGGGSGGSNGTMSGSTSSGSSGGGSSGVSSGGYSGGGGGDGGRTAVPRPPG